MTETAGQRLRDRLDATLAERGPGWEWTSLDLEAIESAARHADRAEQLQKLYDAEIERGDDARAASLTRLASEVRHQERRVLELVAMVSVSDEVPKSKQHQAAADTRWRRKRQREEARVVVPISRES